MTADNIDGIAGDLIAQRDYGMFPRSPLIEFNKFTSLRVY